VPPHEPEYHIQFENDPKLPPEILRVVVIPPQIGEVPEADKGSVDKESIVIVILIHVVVLQVPSAITK
jgi:hypothetical protein